MTSPLTGATLTAQRAQKRWRKYYLAISRPTTIFTARINQATFPSLDAISQFAWDGGTGTYGNVKPGMACWVGSSAGAADIAVLRVRAALTASLVYFGPVSGAQFADNLYLTFVDDFLLDARLPRISPDGTWMDTDVNFGSASSFAPIVRNGPHAEVLALTGASVTHVRPAPTIYSPAGFVAQAYTATAPGASATANLTTSTPSMTYNAPGEYYESRTVTDNSNAVSTIYRKVFVNPVSAQISTPEISGDVDAGGFTCRITGYNGTNVAEWKTYAVSRSRTSNVATFNCQHPHGLTSNDVVNVRDLSGTGYNAEGVTVTVTDSDSFTYPNSGGDEGTTADTGGFFIQVVSANALDIARMMDRALCVVWSRDYVGTALDTSYGPYSNQANVRFVGWLDKETLTIDPITAEASFVIDGPAAWLDKLMGGPATLTSVSGWPVNWGEMYAMTPDAALYQLIKWHSTLADITDVTLTGDTTPTLSAVINSGSLRSQIDALAGEKLFARICFDPQGCGFVTIPASLRTAAGKAVNEILLDTVKSDWLEALDIERVTSENVAQVELSGASYSGSEFAMWSRAPGNVTGRYGSPDAPASSLALASQAVLNQLAGDYLAAQNSEYPSVALRLYWANDFAGYAMAQGWLMRLSIVAADTLRGIVWTDKRFVIEAVSFEPGEGGSETTVIELAEETTGNAGETYSPPPEGSMVEYDLPKDPGNNNPSTSTWFPAYVPPPVVTTGVCNLSGLNRYQLAFAPSIVSGLDAVTSTYVYYPCKIRDNGSVVGPTTIELRMTTYGDAGTNLAFYAIDSNKARLLTGIGVADYDEATPLEQGWTVTFIAPAGGLDCAGFEIALAAGGGYGAFEAGAIVGTGSANGNDAAGTNVAVTPGTLYSIEGTGGPWRNTGLGIFFYNFGRGPGIVEGGVGAIVWNGERPPLTSTMYTDVLTGCLFTESLGPYYGRTYFLADGTGIFNFCCRDTVFGDNYGSLGYILRLATGIGDRKISIKRAQLNNVCALG